MAVKLHYYQTGTGRRPFVEWLTALDDSEARARVLARLYVVGSGSFGDVRSVGEGVMELRIRWGPGYRIYFGRLGDTVVLLLCGGDKRTQDEDIKDATRYFKDFKRRSGDSRSGKT